MSFFKFHNNSTHSQEGITLVELLLSIAILGLVLALGFSLFNYGYRSFTVGEQRSDVRQNIRLATGFITQELRYATHVRVLEAVPSLDLFTIGNGLAGYNSIYVKNGLFSLVQDGEEKNPFSSINTGVILDELFFTIDGELLEYVIKNTGTDDYSITSKLKFLNKITEESTPGLSGKAIAYKSLIPLMDLIPIASAADLYAIRSSSTHLFAQGTDYERETEGGLDKNYYMVNDIDLSSYSNWSPLGDSTVPFTGTFDGKNYMISNLSINRPSFGVDQGLFGIAEGAIIKNVTLDNISIIGTTGIGGLIGRSKDTIIDYVSVFGEVTGNGHQIGGLVGVNEDGSMVLNSSAFITVTGLEHRVGGLVGLNDNAMISFSKATGLVTGKENTIGGLVGESKSSRIENSYSTADVTGDGSNGNGDFVGGLVGQNINSIIKESYATGYVDTVGNYAGGLVGRNDDGSSVLNCYATGNIKGQEQIGGLIGRNRNSTTHNTYSIGFVEGVRDLGGLVGYQSGSTTTTSYWNIETSGQSVSAGGESRTTTELIRQESYDNWESFHTVWDMEGTQNPYSLGLGTTDSPYQIENLTQLDHVRYYTDKHFLLSSDLDLSSISNWKPIGGKNNASYPYLWWQGYNTWTKADTTFTGSFDGNGKGITNLKIVREDEDFVGLFGRVFQGVIKNLTLEDIDVKGLNYNTGNNENATGGLVGQVQGSLSQIINCHVNGEVSGWSRVGGLVGLSNEAFISNSSAAVQVTGDANGTFVGGLIGHFNNNTIEQSFSTGSVKGNNNVGGLVGNVGFNGRIDRSFATGEIEARGMHVGGLVGNFFGGGVEGIISNSYATGKVISTSTHATVGVGGLVGQSESSNAEIINCFAIGEVVHLPNKIAGGLVGINYGIVRNSYYDYETTLKFDSNLSKGVPTSTKNMLKEGTYENWDFVDIWKITENVTYPCLRWQINYSIACIIADQDHHAFDGDVYYVDSDGNIVAMPFKNVIYTIDEDPNWVQLIITSRVGTQYAKEFDYYAPEGVIIESGVEFISNHAQGFIKIQADTGDIVIEEGVKFTTSSNANNSTDEIYLETRGNINVQGVDMQARRYIYFKAGESIYAQNADLRVTHNSRPNVDMNFILDPTGGNIFIDNLYIKFTNVNNKSATAVPLNSLDGTLRHGSDSIG